MVLCIFSLNERIYTSASELVSSSLRIDYTVLNNPILGLDTKVILVILGLDTKVIFVSNPTGTLTLI